MLTFASSTPAASKAPDIADLFTYDPMHPTPSYGGNVCCAGNSIPGTGGALDQRKMEERPDILVYTSEPLKEGIEVSGPITATLYVSSDVKDTDVTVKVIDVLPDGTAYNLDETIQRLRYRDGDDKTVWMEKDKVYKVTLTPMNTSNYFDVGHRIRIEIAGIELPPLRPQPEHRRQQLRRDHRRCRPHCHPPLCAVSQHAHDLGGQTLIVSESQDRRGSSSSSLFCFPSIHDEIRIPDPAGTP